MDRAIDTARISGYEHLRKRIHLPDPGDRHLVAAAAYSQMDLIVTQSLRNFPAEALQTLRL